MQSNQDSGDPDIIPDEGLYEVAPRLLRTFRVSEIADLVEASGFAGVDFLAALFYDPAVYIEDEDLLASIDHMSPWNRFSIGEYFVPRSRHVLFAIKRGSLDKVRNSVLLTAKWSMLGLGVPFTFFLPNLQPHLGEVSLARPKLFHVVPMPTSGLVINEMVEQLAQNSSYMLRYQIPFSTEAYEWPAQPIWEHILRAIDGER